jgi:sugar phosphate isomerase/epimerase
MPNTVIAVNRRRVLKCAAQAAGLAVTALYLPLSARKVCGDTPPLALGEGQGEGGASSPPMKYAICNETFAGWPLEKGFHFAAECGYRGIEIAPFTIADTVTDVSAKRRAEVRRMAKRAGLEVVGLHWLLAKTQGLHLTSPEKEVRRRTAEYLGQLARFCADLGGKIMVFGSPQQRNLSPAAAEEKGTGPISRNGPKGASQKLDLSPFPPSVSAELRQLGMKRAAEVLRRAVPALEKTGVTLAIEPLAPAETNFINTAAEGVELVKLVDSPRCRLHLDCKAMSAEVAETGTGSAGQPAVRGNRTPSAVPVPVSAIIPELIRKYRRWFVHFHANDPNRRGPGFGKLDFVPILKALREIGYRGWVSVEVFDFAPGPERLARESIEYLRKCEALAAAHGSK